MILRLKNYLFLTRNEVIWYWSMYSWNLIIFLSERSEIEDDLRQIVS